MSSEAIDLLGTVFRRYRHTNYITPDDMIDNEYRYYDDSIFVYKDKGVIYSISSDTNCIFKSGIIGMRYNDFKDTWRIYHGKHVEGLIEFDRKSSHDDQRSLLFHEKDNAVDAAAIALGTPSGIYGYLPATSDSIKNLKSLIISDHKLFDVTVVDIDTSSCVDGKSNTAYITVYVTLNKDFCRKNPYSRLDHKDSKKAKNPYKDGSSPYWNFKTNQRSYI